MYIVQVHLIYKLVVHKPMEEENAVDRSIAHVHVHYMYQHKLCMPTIAQWIKKSEMCWAKSGPVKALFLFCHHFESQIHMYKYVDSSESEMQIKEW